MLITLITPLSLQGEQKYHHEIKNRQTIISKQIRQNKKKKTATATVKQFIPCPTISWKILSGIILIR